MTRLAESDLAGGQASPDPHGAATIWAADFTTGPTGQRVTSEQRVADIRFSYAADEPVIVALDASMSDLVRAMEVAGA